MARRIARSSSESRAPTLMPNRLNSSKAEPRAPSHTVSFGADDGFQPGTCGRLVESRNAVDAVAIEQRQRRIPEIARRAERGLPAARPRREKKTPRRHAVRCTRDPPIRVRSTGHIDSRSIDYPSMNHRPVSRAWNNRQTEPSLSATSHSSRSQGRRLTIPPGARRCATVRRTARPAARHAAAIDSHTPGRPRSTMTRMAMRRTETAQAQGPRSGRRMRRPARAAEPRVVVAARTGASRRHPARANQQDRAAPAARLADERAEPRRQRRQRFRRRPRPLEQRVLEHAARRRIDLDRRRCRSAAEGGCDSRSSTSSVRSTRGSRMAAGSCSTARVRGAIDEPQIQADGRDAPGPRARARRQRLEQPRQHERQRLESVNRPLELHALEKPPALPGSGTSGPGSIPRARCWSATPACPSRAETARPAAPPARRAS